ncbi:N-acetylglucosaminyl transferase component-domain-containing protein [Cytidiella melzeri]|nr:N-acetylglucosaminyl transferase component-domain-containing protein [Cytidiella melzeri]
MPGHLPVLWPDDVSGNGFIYGWTSPLFSVAGILHVKSLDEAEAALQQAKASQDWSPLIELCGAFPAVVGRIGRGDGSTPEVSPDNLHLFNSNAQYLLIRYAKPRLPYLEMYTLDAVLSAGLYPAHPQATISNNANICLHDFTKPSNQRFKVLDWRVIGQMNFGQCVTSKLMELHNEISACSSNHVRSITMPLDDSELSAPFNAGISSMSKLALQVTTRFRQLCYLYSHFPPPSFSRNSMSPKAISNYVRFYNCIWLILNDTIIGFALGTYICDNVGSLSYILNQWIQELMIEDVQGSLLWLNSWPAGLKLNTELSGLYCYSLLSVIMMWNKALTHFVLPHVDKVIFISGTIGCCGVTMTTALLNDLLSLITAHLYLCYSLSHVVFGKQLDAVGALWKLFRGKRRNVLRRRTDSWVFDVDQLLFGTILFTLLAFISPTTTAYYMLFAATRLCTVLVYDVLDVVLTLISHFPLFALMLHLKDPFRLPEGMVLQIDNIAKSYWIQSRTIPMSSIFGHYFSSLSSSNC